MADYSMMNTASKVLIALVIGLLFGAGLATSEMTNPGKVQNFFDFSGNWDPSLLLVMVSAVVTNYIGYKLVFKRHKPTIEKKFHLPDTQKITPQLIIGSAIFGIGWGLSGYCPGPVMAAVTYGALEPILFTLAMLGGFYLRRQMTRVGV
ncbi:MAG: YeeE/YedE family protein [Xanthomonadales bacterium]|nr:YeeE/YedE family protein [Xanthomonadales bacterium]